MVASYLSENPTKLNDQFTYRVTVDTEYRNLLVLTLLALILIIFLDLFSMTFQMTQLLVIKLADSSAG